jgi:predicted nucleic acid-binding protein
MTRLPVKPPIPTEQAILFIRQIRELFTVVPLSQAECFSTIERLAAQGLARNFIYDGLIMTAAAKSNASVIYTWNTAGFLKVAPPGLHSRIRTP